MINDSQLDLLRTRIAARMSEKRYLHTLGVERAAALISSYCMPEREYELRAAALLHDVAKELDPDVMKELLINRDKSLTEEDFSSPSVLHSFAAEFVVRDDFSELATTDIISAVRNHTVGDGNMSLFDEIIFLADFIEDTRSYDACKNLRKELLNSFSDGDVEHNINAVHIASLKMIEFTLKYLEERNKPINRRMLDAARMLRSKISN